jgi:hypothetical protein
VSRRSLPHPLPSLLRRLLAAGGAALVFALGLMAVDPSLHALAHAHPHDSGHAGCPHHHHADLPADDAKEHTCAVVLFAQGVALTAAAAAPEIRAVVWHKFFPVAVGEIFLTAPRYLLQPERGPPVG